MLPMLKNLTKVLPLTFHESSILLCEIFFDLRYMGNPIEIVSHETILLTLLFNKMIF